MTYDTAHKLADELKNSAEYRAYQDAKGKAYASDTTKNLIAEYHKLQLQAQSAMLSGKRDEEQMQKLQKLGEVLQFDPAAAAFLMAEYRLNGMLGDVYKILAEAVDVDLGALGADA